MKKEMKMYATPKMEACEINPMTALCGSRAEAGATGANGESGDGNGGNPLFPPFGVGKALIK